MSRGDLLKELNPQQREAVLHGEGPLLVFAGAGSGKTRVITHRFAYLTTAHKVHPSSILTMTFTNKAADEMKVRIEDILGRSIKGLWIGTFHSLCCRILRREINRLGFNSDFCIYDEHDTCSLIRSILKTFKIHEALYKGFASRLSSLKASLITPEDFLKNEDSYGYDEKFARVYVRYQEELKKNNALDFDDLILYTVKLFERYPDVLKRYQDEFHHIMIDEFQDTNLSQYRLSKILASKNKNICVVGDDDQSIYRFRGANVGNILAFKNDFPKVKIIRLEQNYRSTRHILNAAGGVISRNSMRMPKRLWTEKVDGEKIFYCITDTDKEEGRYIAKTIKELYLKGKYSYSDFAILYRLNNQSRVLEDAMREVGLPYRVIGGISFYHRKEVKDITSYLKVIVNPDDSINLKRIINSPPRGIGDATITRIENEARKKGKGLFATMRHIIGSKDYPPSLKEKLKGFVELIDELIRQREMELSKLIELIFERTGYLEWIGEERADNLMELLNSAIGKDIRGFIDTASLYSPSDESTNNNAVFLMTLHCAKGLEFPVVFIAGVEDGLIPYFHATKEKEELEEERRLFYVGITRAKEMLFITRAKKRRLYAAYKELKPSRFLEDIPVRCYHCYEKRTGVGDHTPLAERPAQFMTTTPFVAGVKVRHPKWGIGVVRESYGDNDDVKVMVNFASVGIKRLSLKLAQLERI
ncbi:MAG: UvrD-helicase domain-containing protein [Thermodesulfovibrionia bacterium]